MQRYKKKVALTLILHKICFHRLLSWSFQLIFAIFASDIRLNNTDVDELKQDKKDRPFWLKIASSLALMCLIGLVMLWLSTYWLDMWTHHGDYAMVPNVKGMHFDVARELLESQDFEVVLQDSVFEDKVKPGTVIEQNPKDSMEVKPGRTVYLTINAFYPRTVMLPVLTDISVRQARSTLEGMGFADIRIKEIPSEYEDLVFAVIYKGKPVKAGTRVPLAAQITLEVGVALDYESMQADTLTDSSPAEATGQEQLNESPVTSATVVEPSIEPTHASTSGNSADGDDDEPSFFD